MIETQAFGKILKDTGFDFYSGVPCSFLKDLINYAINECEYVMATNEGDAVAISSGAALGGRKAVVLMQNSGLTNATSPLTSLNYSFRLPVLGFVSLRGEPGLQDEPQHELMGQITTQMLSLMEVKWEYLADTLEEATHQVARANAAIEGGHTFFFVVKKGTFDKVALRPQTLATGANERLQTQTGANEMPIRTEALKTLHRLRDDHTVLLATTGKTGRELFEVGDTPHNLYMVGSMGCISSLGLGLALARPEKRVMAIDGDGALMMRMGAMPTLGYYRPGNLLHVLLDNHAHDSTGGQATVSHAMDLVAIAAASGYTRAIHAHSLAELEQAVNHWKQAPALTFLYMEISAGSPPQLGRPTVKPHEVKERLMQFLG
jgi:phosphonopyruvate decarboxylase